MPNQDILVPPRYVIISPVKDEERYVEFTLRSVISQSLKPSLWLIVDDGSTDRTPEIIRHFQSSNPFIRLISNPKAGQRKLAFAEVRAFNLGFESLGNLEYDFIVKLDCDLSFDPDYFEKLLARFIQNQKLGIASGVYFEQDKYGCWTEIEMPTYHAAGASKVIRKTCFQQIGGFTPAPGWDTVDEIRALGREWTTLHFTDLKMKHLKGEGSSIGAVKTSLMQGEAYYRSGGSKFFFILKILHRAKSRPYLVRSLAMLWGYLRAMQSRAPLLVTESEAHLYKKMLMNRIKMRAMSLLRMS